LRVDLGGLVDHPCDVGLLKPVEAALFDRDAVLARR
jgi:hypothetical protein